MINIVSETLKLVIFNGKCNILLQLSVKIHPNLYYWIKMQRTPFTANLIMVPSWHFGVSSTFFQVSSGRNGRKWKKTPFFQFLPNVRKKPISSGRNPTRITEYFSVMYSWIRNTWWIIQKLYSNTDEYEYWIRIPQVWLEHPLSCLIISLLVLF